MDARERAKELDNLFYQEYDSRLMDSELRFLEEALEAHAAEAVAEYRELSDMLRSDLSQAIKDGDISREGWGNAIETREKAQERCAELEADAECHHVDHCGNCQHLKREERSHPTRGCSSWPPKTPSLDAVKREVRADTWQKAGGFAINTLHAAGDYNGEGGKDKVLAVRIQRGCRERAEAEREGRDWWDTDQSQTSGS